MDTWRVSNSVSFINRSRKRRKASKFCLPTLGTSALLIRRGRGGRRSILHTTYHFNRSPVPREISRNFSLTFRVVTAQHVSRRMVVNLPPEFRGRVHALDNGGCWKGRKWREEEEKGIPSGSQAKVLALSRHRVLRGDGT